MSTSIRIITISTRFRNSSRACLENVDRLITMSVTLDDKVVGNNLRILRGNMSQEELANKMRDSGFKWSKATVWSVEQGQRPLRLTEARAALTCLNQNSMFALNKLVSISTLAAITMYRESIETAVDEIIEALDHISLLRVNLALNADQAIESEEGLPGAIEMGVAETLLKSMPDNISKEYLMHSLYKIDKEEFDSNFYEKYDSSTMSRALYDQIVKEARKKVPASQVLHGFFTNILSDNERLEYLADPKNYHRKKNADGDSDNDGVDS